MDSNDASHSAQVTKLLTRLTGGDPAAESELIPLIYRPLHDMALALLRNERQGHSLQATLLVNEVLVRVLRGAHVDWTGTSHFFAIAARQMRRFLVDHARTVRAEKRQGKLQRVDLDVVAIISKEHLEDAIAVDQALERLARVDPRQAQVVEMRYFGGLSVDQIATVLQVAPRTVKRDWQIARAWLYGELKTSRTQAAGEGA